MSNISSQAPSIPFIDSLDLNIRPNQPSKKTNRCDAQIELKTWLEKKFELEFNSERCFSATFLFVDSISREKAIAQYTNFISNLNRKIYGNAYKRFPLTKRIKNISIIEGSSSGKNYHYHSVLGNPIDRNFSDDEFIRLVSECWLSQPKSMKNRDVAVKMEKLYYFESWVGYLTKLPTKENTNGIIFQDSLDTINSYF